MRDSNAIRIFSPLSPLPVSWVCSLYHLSSPCILSILLSVYLLHSSPSLCRLTFFLNLFSPYDGKIVTVSSWTLYFIYSRDLKRNLSFSSLILKFPGKDTHWRCLGQLSALCPSNGARGRVTPSRGCSCCNLVYWKWRDVKVATTLHASEHIILEGVHYYLIIALWIVITEHFLSVL